MEQETITLPLIQELESKYIMQTYARNPVLFVRGKGSVLIDSTGKKYIDFLTGIGVNVLGYDHARIRKVLKEQGDLLHTSNLFYHPYQGLLAEKLTQMSGMSRVFYCNSGSEANEGALKLARAWQRSKGREDKYEFVAMTNSFHGRTFGSLSVTAQEKYRKPFEPLVPGVKFLNPTEATREDVFNSINEKTAAVILETIQGESGVYPLDPNFLKMVREACDATDTLLIMDEVQCGLGRTGRIFAFQNTEVRPDILCVAKPLGLGIPIGAFLVNEKAADGLAVGLHGTTFGGGPLACRLSLEFITMLQEEDLLKRVIDSGTYFKKQLRSVQRHYPDLVKEVRGSGLMLGMELKIPGKPIVTSMLENGFIINCTHDYVLRFLPPYIIKKSEISSMIDSLEMILKEYRV